MFENGGIVSNEWMNEWMSEWDLLMIEDEFGSSHSGGVVSDERPSGRIQVVKIEIWLGVLKSSRRTVDVSAQKENLPPLL